MYCRSLTLIALLWPALALADLTKVGMGIDCSTGHYGQASVTKVCTLPISIDIFRGNYEVKITAPYVGIRSESSRATGSGDASIYLAKALDRPPSGVDEVDVAARVKLKNGDAGSGLGNGQYGYQFEAGIAKTWSGHLLITYLGLSSKSMTADHKIAPYTSLWYKKELSQTWTLGWIYENSNLLDASRAVADIVFIPEYRATPKVTLKPMVYKGLTKSSPNLGVGMLVTYAIE